MKAAMPKSSRSNKRLKMNELCYYPPKAKHFYPKASGAVGKHFMELVPFFIIKAAKESTMEAVSVIRRRLGGYIVRWCLNSYIGADGNSHLFVDPGLRDQI